MALQAQVLGATAFGPELSDDEIQGAIFDIDGPCPAHDMQSLLQYFRTDACNSSTSV